MYKLNITHNIQQNPANWQTTKNNCSCGNIIVRNASRHEVLNLMLWSISISHPVKSGGNVKSWWSHRYQMGKMNHRKASEHCTHLNCIWTQFCTCCIHKWTMADWKIINMQSHLHMSSQSNLGKSQEVKSKKTVWCKKGSKEC